MKMAENSAVFRQLGFGDPLIVSAIPYSMDG